MSMILLELDYSVFVRSAGDLFCHLGYHKGLVNLVKPAPKLTIKKHYEKTTTNNPNPAFEWVWIYCRREAIERWKKEKERYFSNVEEMDTEQLLRELVKSQWLKDNIRP